MSYYATHKDEAISTFQEEIATLEDALDVMQEERDERERVLSELFLACYDHCHIMANQFWWEEPLLREMFPATYFPEEPGKCVSETSLTQDGNKPKSYCKLWERWTNCREVGHCVKAAANE